MKEYQQSGGKSESPKKSSTKSPKKPSTSKKVTLPIKSGGIISKEFIGSDDDSSLSESDKKNKTKTNKVSEL